MPHYRQARNRLVSGVKRRRIHLDVESMRRIQYSNAWQLCRKTIAWMVGCEPKWNDGKSEWWWAKKRPQPNTNGALPCNYLLVVPVTPRFCQVGDVFVADCRSREPSIHPRELLVMKVGIERYYAHTGWHGDTAEIYMPNGKMIVDNPWCWVVDCAVGSATTT